MKRLRKWGRQATQMRRRDGAVAPGAQPNSMGPRLESHRHEATEDAVVADSHAEEVVQTGSIKDAPIHDQPGADPGVLDDEAVDAEAAGGGAVYSSVAQRPEDPSPSHALLSKPPSDARSPGCREWLAARTSKQCASPAMIGCVGVGTTFMVATAVLTVALLHGGLGSQEPEATTTIQATVRNNLAFVSTSTSTSQSTTPTTRGTGPPAVATTPAASKEQPATTTSAPKGTTSQKPATQNEVVKAEWGWDLFKAYRVTPKVLRRNKLGAPLQELAKHRATVAFESFMGTFLATRGDGTITMVNRELTSDTLFQLESHGSMTFAIRSLVNNKYVDLGADGAVWARRASPALGNLFQAKPHDFLIALYGLKTKHNIDGRELYTKHRHLRVRALGTFFPNSAPGLRMQAVGDTSVAFQTTYQTFLSAGKSGSVTALNYSVGPEETFKMHPSNSPGWVYFTTSAGKLLSFEGATMTAKGTSHTKCTAFNLVELPNESTFKFVMFGCGNRTLVISESPINTFYVYRACAPGTDYLGNINVANIPGVLWYLHNEVVVEVPRKFGVTRIRRMKVHVTGTQELADNGLTQGVRFAYDRGICTGAGPNETWLGRGSCEQYYQKYGFFVGCNVLGLYPFPMASQGFPVHYPHAAWYTLPEKGRCHGIPSGTKTCTYSVEDAGEVSMDELVGIHNYDEWIKQGNKEYEYFTDKGVGTDFWRQKFNDTMCQHRVDLLRKLFVRKYPNEPSDLELREPPCDFDCSRFYVPPLPAAPEECNATLQALKAKGVKPLASPEWIHG